MKKYITSMVVAASVLCGSDLHASADEKNLVHEAYDAIKKLNDSYNFPYRRCGPAGDIAFDDYQEKLSEANALITQNKIDESHDIIKRLRQVSDHYFQKICALDDERVWNIRKEIAKISDIFYKIKKK